MNATLIRGGHVADGLGGPLVRRDIVVERGRISRLIAPTSRGETGGHVIDATELIVSPGFIDLHSHADYTVERESMATGQLAQGVTSIVTGNCGWSPFPVKHLHELREWSAFLGGNATYEWRDFSGFADRVDAARPAINVLPLVGHSPVRITALGGADRVPNARELLMMRELVAGSISQGAWGFSSGLIYAPGSFATAHEVAELVRAAAEAGALYATHVRDETSRVLDAFDEAIEAADLARRSGASPRLQISHIKAMGPANHGIVPQLLTRIADARTDGLDVAADVYPYTASGTTLASRLPDWALDGGAALLIERLAHDGTRDRIREALDARFERHDFDPAGIVLMTLSSGRFADARGLSLTDLASRLHVSPGEAALLVLAAHKGVVGIINHAMAEDDLQAAISHPMVAIASDGGRLVPDVADSGHPRAFGTFPRIFARYVREQGLISLEEAVRKCTSLPASRLGLRGRGVLREGAVADIAIFDPVEFTDLADYTNPNRLATGMHTVLVNGNVAWSAGQQTGVRAGGVLRREKSRE
ncbi:MAG: N-acyl-D-amino-acid deacylase family protein [Leucobacter sp.]